MAAGHALGRQPHTGQSRSGPTRERRLRPAGRKSIPKPPKPGSEANPSNSEKLTGRFGRACYDWADYATSNTQRAEIAKEGIAACRLLIDRQPESAWGHYYLAMDMGQLAQTKKLGALRLVRQMEGEFKIAVGLDQKLDFAGPDRNLGLLYLEAPGWPTSIGSKARARQHLERAVELSPDYPENILNLAEAEARWGEKNAAMRGLATSGGALVMKRRGGKIQGRGLGVQLGGLGKTPAQPGNEANQQFTQSARTTAEIGWRVDFKPAPAPSSTRFQIVA